MEGEAQVFSWEEVEEVEGHLEDLLGVGSRCCSFAEAVGMLVPALRVIFGEPFF